MAYALSDEIKIIDLEVSILRQELHKLYIASFLATAGLSCSLLYFAIIYGKRQHDYVTDSVYRMFFRRRNFCILYGVNWTLTQINSPAVARKGRPYARRKPANNFRVM